MHDIKLVKKIIEQAKKQGANREIHLEIGELSEFPTDELIETIKNFTNWNVKIDTKASKIQCDCGYEGKAQVLERGHGFCLFNCPQCNGKPKVLEGGEIKIIGVA